MVAKWLLLPSQKDEPMNKLLLCLLLATQAMGQPQVLSGRVTEAGSGLGIAGAYVLTSGSTGTMTNPEGFFRLTVPLAVDSLTVSCLGYETARLSTQASGQVSLKKAVYRLAEVQVVGKSALAIVREAMAAM